MNKYISKVISKIANKTYKSRVEAELQSHIDDRAEYYINAGYDKETAYAKATEQMGDTAELVGEQLNSMIDEKCNNFLFTIFVLINTVILVYTFCFGFLIIADSENNTDIFMLVISSAYFIYLSVQLFAAIKIKKAFLAFSSFVMAGIYGLIMRGYVPFVFSLYEFVTGNGKDLGDLFTHSFIIGNVFIKVLCISFIILFAVFSICIFIHVIRFKAIKNGRHFSRDERIFKIIISVLLVVIISQAVFAYFSEPASDDEFAHMESVSGFYFIESDEKTAADQIKNAEKFQIMFKPQLVIGEELIATTFSNEDLSNTTDFHNYPFANSALNTVYAKYDNMNKDVFYSKDTIVSDFYTDKKYLMIVPAFEYQKGNGDRDYYPDFRNCKWVEIKEQTVIKSKEREFKHYGAYLEYEIRVIPEK